jgi:hypothetical protein
MQPRYGNRFNPSMEGKKEMNDGFGILLAGRVHGNARLDSPPDRVKY